MKPFTVYRGIARDERGRPASEVLVRMPTLSANGGCAARSRS